MPRRSILNRFDNVLLVIVVIIAAIIAINVIGAVVGFAWFLMKIAIVTALVAGVWRVVSGRRHELDRRHDHELYR